jgi:hypothetical protein
MIAIECIFLSTADQDQTVRPFDWFPLHLHADSLYDDVKAVAASVQMS